MPTKTEIKWKLDRLTAELDTIKKAQEQELQARDDLIQLLKEKVEQLQKHSEPSKSRNSSRSGTPESEVESAPVSTQPQSSPGGVSSSERGESQSADKHSQSQDDFTEPADVFLGRRGCGHVYLVAPQIHSTRRVGVLE